MIKWLIPIMIVCVGMTVLYLVEDTTVVFVEGYASHVNGIMELSQIPNMTNSLNYAGLTIEPTVLGTVRVWKDQKLAGAVGFSLTGTVYGQNYIGNSYDWAWAWGKEENEIIMQEYLSNGSIMNITFNEITLTGWNQRADFNITQIFKSIYPDGIKHEIILTNNFVPITNFKVWLLNSIEKDDIFTYNGTEYNYEEYGDVSLGGNFDNILPKVDFGDTYIYRYEDLIDSGYNITNILIGNASIFNAPEALFMGIGVRKNDGSFTVGNKLILDPIIISDYFTPSAFGGSCPGATNAADWTLPTRLEVSDNSRSYTSTLNHRHDTCNYDIDLLNGTVINGLEVSLEGLSDCVAGCPAKPGAYMSVRISWDGGGNWTNWVKGAKYLTTAESTKTFPTRDPLISNWSHNWNIATGELSNSKLIVQINFSQQDANTDFKSPDGMDQIRLRLNYTSPSPVLSWVDDTPNNFSVIGSYFRSNFTSINGVPFDNCSLTFRNSTDDGFLNIVYSPASDGKTCTRYQFVENFTYKNFSVYGSALYEGVPDTYTSIAWYLSNNTKPPIITYSYPIEGGIYDINNMTFNFTAYDPENDRIDVFLDIMRNSSELQRGRINVGLEINGSSFSRYVGVVPYGLTDDLSDYLAYYPMNNESVLGESENLIYDYIGYSNGSLIGSGSYATEFGRWNYGYFFNDADGADLATSSSLFGSDLVNTDKGFTISTWVYPTEYSSAHFVDIIGAGLTYFYIGTSGTNGALTYAISGDGSFGKRCDKITGASQYSLNQWSHIAVSYNNKTRYLRLYKNGALIDSVNCAGDFTYLNSTAWDRLKNTSVGTGAENLYIDHIEFLNINYTESYISRFRSMEDGDYYWNVTAVEYLYTTANGTHVFTLGVAETNCNIDCSTNPTLETNTDCGGEDLIFANTGTVEVQANYTNWDEIKKAGGCEVRGWQRLLRG